MNKYSLYLNQDLDFNKNKDLIESSINSLPLNEESKHYLVSKVADTKNINKLQDKVDECNEIIDQLSSNPGSYLDLDSGKVITPSDLADELRDRENTINELQDKLNKAKDSKSRSELESELNESKERRKEVIEKVTRTVNEGLNKIVGTSKDLLSGDPDKVLNAITDSFFGILGLLTKGLVNLVSKGIELNEKRKLNKLTQKDKDEVNKIKLDPKVESNQSKVDSKWLTENNIQNKINMARSEELFKNVDKITDWKSAFDYGYAKLKQVFGDKFDKKIADATLNGLKEKYPNNPMVVVGALKYGRHSDEDKNSRAVNSRVTDIASKYVGKLNNSNFREIFKSIASDFGFSNISIPSHIGTLSDFMWYGGFDESIPDDVFMAMELLCDYYGSDVNLNSRQSDDRQKVDPKTLELAKSEGVVQKKPNGKWGIISLKSGEWWTADYQSEDSARNALKAYHARKGNSIGFNSKFTNSKESKEVYFPDKMPEKVRIRLNYWKDLDSKINELLGTSKSQLSLDIPYFEGRKCKDEEKRDLFDKKSGIMGIWLFALNLDGINGTVFNCLRKSGLGEYKKDHLYGSNYLEMYQIPLTKGVDLYEYLKSNLGRCNSVLINSDTYRYKTQSGLFLSKDNGRYTIGSIPGSGFNTTDPDKVIEWLFDNCVIYPSDNTNVRLNSRKVNSIKWKPKVKGTPSEYRGPIAVVPDNFFLNVNPIHLVSEVLDKNIGFIDDSFVDEVFNGGIDYIYDPDFPSKFTKQVNNAGWDRSDMFFTVKGPDGKLYTISDIVTESEFNAYNKKYDLGLKLEKSPFRLTGIDSK